MDWFLYNRDVRHEGDKEIKNSYLLFAHNFDILSSFSNSSCTLGAVFMLALSLVLTGDFVSSSNLSISFSSFDHSS